MMMFSLYQSKLNPVYTNYSINQSNETSIIKLKCQKIINLKFIFFLNKVSIIDRYEANPGSQNGVNLLGTLVFCLIFGNIIGKMGQSGKMLHDLFEIIGKAFLDMIGVVIWYNLFFHFLISFI